MRYPGSRDSLRGERGENGHPLVTSIANLTSTLDLVQNLNLACDWPFVKICQTGLENKHYCTLIYSLY